MPQGQQGIQTGITGLEMQTYILCAKCVQNRGMTSDKFRQLILLLRRFECGVSPHKLLNVFLD